LNNQLGALTTLSVSPSPGGGGDAVQRRHSLLVGGPPRGITLSRQNSISSQTTAERSSQKGSGSAGVTRRPSSCTALHPQPSNDARTTGCDRLTTTTPTTCDLSDFASTELAAKNLEAGNDNVQAPYHDQSQNCL